MQIQLASTSARKNHGVRTNALKSTVGSEQLQSSSALIFENYVACEGVFSHANVIGRAHAMDQCQFDRETGFITARM